MPSPIDVTPNMVFDAEESAYASYSAKVLDMVLGRLGDGTRNYLRAIAATMDERGVMRSDASIAEALGKRPESISSYRTRLKALGIIDDPGRGTLVFRIPYVMRYLDEGPIVREDEPDDGDEQHFVMN